MTGGGDRQSENHRANLPGGQVSNADAAKQLIVSELREAAKARPRADDGTHRSQCPHNLCYHWTRPTSGAKKTHRQRVPMVRFFRAGTYSTYSGTYFPNYPFKV